MSTKRSRQESRRTARPLKTFGGKLRKWRTRQIDTEGKKLTQVTASKILGVKQSWIADLEAGRIWDPSTGVLQKIANAYDIGYEDALGALLEDKYNLKMNDSLAFTSGLGKVYATAKLVTDEVRKLAECGKIQEGWFFLARSDAHYQPEGDENPYYSAIKTLIGKNVLLRMWIANNVARKNSHDEMHKRLKREGIGVDELQTYLTYAQDLKVLKRVFGPAYEAVNNPTSFIHFKIVNQIYFLKKKPALVKRPEDLICYWTVPGDAARPLTGIVIHVTDGEKALADFSSLRKCVDPQ
ncbi:MAG: helix-turn-helix domain-containing protein [Phycisphaerales bacterium]|nr:helix-turn-helix domain-containing protein [Phycisphaerales bacterium]